MRTIVYINNVNVISNEVIRNYCCIKLPSETNNNYFIICTCNKSLNLQPHQMITFSFETSCCRSSAFNFTSDVNPLTKHFLWFKSGEFTSYCHRKWYFGYRLSAVMPEFWSVEPSCGTFCYHVRVRKVWSARSVAKRFDSTYVNRTARL